MAAATPGAETRTSIDALVELLREKGKMDVNMIAGTLGISPAIVESWAKVLEKGGIVRISYEVGRMFIEPVTLSPEQAKMVASKVEVQRGIVQENIAAQRSEAEKFATEINSLGTEVASLERIYQQRMPAVQQMLSQINTLYDSIVEQGKAVDQIKRNAEDSYQGVNRRIDELTAKIDSLGSIDTSKLKGKGALAPGGAQEALKNANAAYDSLNSLSRSKDRLFESLVQNVDAQVGAFKQQINATKKEVEMQLNVSNARIAQILSELNAQSKSSREVMEQLGSFRKEVAGAKKLLNNSRIQFTDRYERLEETMRGGSALLEQDSRALLDRLGDLKAAFGDVARIDNALREVRKSVEAMAKQVADARDAVAELQQTIQALNSMTLTPEQRLSLTNELKKKVQDSGKNIANIGKEIQDTKGKFHGKQ